MVGDPVPLKRCLDAYFSDELLTELQSSLLRQRAVQEREKEQQRFMRYQKLLRDVSASIEFGDMPTFDEFVWANGVLNSRRIWWNNRGHLVPLLDAINCRSPSNQPVHRTTGDNDLQMAITRAPRDFAEGEEVFENYGQSNFIYFLYHGFSLTPNPHDCVFVKPKSINLERCASVKLRHGMQLEEFVEILDSYETSIDEDKDILKKLVADQTHNADDSDTELSKRIAIVRFRLTEKRVLQKIIDTMRQEQDKENAEKNDELRDEL